MRGVPEADGARATSLSASVCIDSKAARDLTTVDSALAKLTMPFTTHAAWHSSLSAHGWAEAHACATGTMPRPFFKADRSSHASRVSAPGWSGVADSYTSESVLTFVPDPSAQW